MNIHLIRHGKTIANEKKLYCGQTDLPLSENGICELMELKEQQIYPKNVDLFFTSGLLRTEQTLELIYGCEAIKSREILPKLSEYKFGHFEMKRHEELKDLADYQAWINNSAESCPAGESRQQFMTRILEGYDLLLEKAKGANTVLLVSHGGVIASIMEHLFPNKRNFYEWQPAPGRGHVITEN